MLPSPPSFHLYLVTFPGAMAASMEATFKAMLTKCGVHADIIQFFEKPENGVTTLRRFANFLDSRAEVQSHVLDQVASVRSNRAQKTILTELWREADIAETARLEQKAKGASQDDRNLQVGIPHFFCQPFDLLEIEMERSRYTHQRRRIAAFVDLAKDVPLGVKIVNDMSADSKLLKIVGNMNAVEPGKVPNAH